MILFDIFHKGGFFMIEIVITDSLELSDKVMKEFTAAFPQDLVHFTIYNTRPASQEELGERLSVADMAIITSYPLTKKALDMAPNLRYLLIGFTGTNHVDTEELMKRHILYSNCPGYSSDSVAELAIGMTLSLLRNLPEADKGARNGLTTSDFMGSELHGKRFGIIGTGTIGAKTAALARAFGCVVYGTSRHENLDFVRYVPLEDLLKLCDIISIHVPLNEETKGLIGEKEIALMKPSAILINTARGPIVDEEALAKALSEGRIGGAGIDVFDEEPPLAKSPLLTAPHTLLTPHIGYHTKEAMLKRAHTLHHKLLHWVTSAIVEKRVNRAMDESGLF